MSKKIGIDCDDVLFKFNEGLTVYMKAQFGIVYELEKILDYELSNVWGCSQQEANKRVYDFYHSNHHRNLVPVDGSVKSLASLGRKYDLSMITSRPESVRGITLDLVDKFFPNIFKDTHFLGHFIEGERSTKTKGELCKEVGIETLVDDSLSTALSAMHFGVKVLLFDAPWNQGNITPNVTRVFSWDDVMAHLS